MISWEEGIQELLKAYQATLLKPDTWSPASLFFQCSFHLDFQPAIVMRLTGSGDLMGVDAHKLPSSMVSAMGEAEAGTLQGGRPHADKEATCSKGTVAIRGTIPNHQGSQVLFLPALR